MQKCMDPNCDFMAHPDPEISIGFCCEKCEGRFNGEAWGMAGKRHTAVCTSKFKNAGADMTWGCGGGCAPGWDAGAFNMSPEALSAAEAAEGAEGSEVAVEAYDPDTEGQLDRWVELKKAKEFEAADALREELRATGIEPSQARPAPGQGAKGAKGGGGWARGGMAPAWMKGGWGPEPCANPDCVYTKNSDPSISKWYCCEKCEGVATGADWAQGGKKHYKNCEKIEHSSYGPIYGGMGGMDGWGGKGGWGMGKGAGKWGPY